jgi:archaellum component FlaF (FlaF/FlaG flagellin family)
MEKRYKIILGSLVACLMFLLVFISIIYLSLLDEEKTIKNEYHKLNEKEQEKAEKRVSIPKGRENYTYVFND